MHCLLLGNGINRLSEQLDWTAILKRLAMEFPAKEEILFLDQKPLSMFFEELCAGVPGNFRSAESQVKKKISAHLKRIPVDPLLKSFADSFEVILTTNYDHAIEECIAGPLYYSACLMQESRYSLFRRNFAGLKQVWHIHGDISYPESIVLGYDHYAGYLQKIRNYQVDGLSPKQIKGIFSNLPHSAKIENRTFSWVDHFVRDHLHIVGIGLDFTEMDIWWLLLHKRRRDKKTGLTFFYYICLADRAESSESAKLSLLKSLGVRVHCVIAKSYREGYEKILEVVRVSIVENPELLPNFSGFSNSTMPLPWEGRNCVKRKADPQLSLGLKRRT